MLTKRRMYDSTIEEDLRSLGYVIKYSKGVLELVIIVMRQRLHPCLDFLLTVNGLPATGSALASVPASGT